MVGCLVLAAVVAALLPRTGERHADLAAPPNARTTPDPAAAAADLLRRLHRALRNDDRRALASLADPRHPGSRTRLAAVAANVRALRIGLLVLRYVDTSTTPLSTAERKRYGARGWTADVQVTWRLGGLDPAAATVEVPMVLGWRRGRAVFETALAAGPDRVPLWLLDRLVVRRTRDTLVMASDAVAATSAGREAAVAVATVRRALPGWHGPLVVEAPADRRQFRASAGMSAQDARAIAAVTTTTDGSTTATAPVHVYLNPPVFDALGPVGRQIVVSHEATHVALGAATTSMPLWLSEGTADYVALARSRLPVTTLASQIRGLVARRGAPATLPGREEFSGSDRATGAWYEAAWLAARLIARQHGAAALLRFYRVADQDGTTGRAFRVVLHTTEDAFVEQWRAQLVALSRR